MPDQAAAFREAALTRHPLIEFGAAQVGAGHPASLATEREFTDLICRTVAEVERARVEFFASLPTQREFIDLICRTVLRSSAAAWNGSPASSPAVQSPNRPSGPI
jgi:hypothetical protein